MSRFCVTARICRPNGVRRISQTTSAEHGEGEDDDVEPVVGDDEAADRLETAGHPIGIGDLLVRRAEHRAHRLLQDQADAPGREQGFKRAAVEKADDAALERDADQAGNAKGDGQRNQNIGAEKSRRQHGAKNFLDDIGGIGANHDHFAMRHVDDAEHAEADGEADGGEQQDAAEADALENILADFDPAPARFEIGKGGIGRLAHIGIDVGAGAQSLEQGAHLRIVRARQIRDRLDALGLAADGDAQAEQAVAQRGGDLGVFFLRQRLFQQRHGVGAAELEGVARGGEAIGLVRTEQHEAAQRRGDGAAQPVVDRNFLKPVRLRFAQLFAADGIADGDGIAIALGDDELAVEREKPAVMQRLQRRHRLAVAERAQGFDRREPGGKAFGRELLHRGRKTVGGMGRAPWQEQQQQQRSENAAHDGHSFVPVRAARERAARTPGVTPRISAFRSCRKPTGKTNPPSAWRFRGCAWTTHRP